MTRDADSTPDAAVRAVPGPRRWQFWVAVAAQLAVGVFPYLVTGLVAPRSGVVVAAVLWLAATGWLVLVRHRRWLPLAVPPATLAAWVVLVSLGDVLLGWTA